MILSALVDLYENLSARGVIAQRGYASGKVSWAMELAADGTLLSLLPLVENVTRGKKTVEVPVALNVPEASVRSVSIVPQFLCDNCGYLLGLDAKGKPERTLNCFVASKELHSLILSRAQCDAARAVIAFFDKWDPEKAATHPAIEPHLTALLKGGNMVFRMNGQFVHDDPNIRRAWAEHNEATASPVRMRCLVTGEDAPIAVLHGKIKGVRGAQSTGASIVSFNAPSLESFNREQGLNAPVSEYAAFAYVSAINHLLADDKHRCLLGDTTLVYWAQTGDPLAADVFSMMLSGNPESVDQDAQLSGIMQKLVNGEPIIGNLDINVPFHVLGLSPNAGRISVRFYLRDTLGSFLNNLRAHYERLEIDKSAKERKYLLPYAMLQETVNLANRDKSAQPLLAGAVLRAILLNARYPESLYSAVMSRIRCEQDNPDRRIYKITSGRAAIIKAYYLRNRNDNREVLTVSVNEQSNNRAYVLGRLFSVLENIQLKANPGINTTIKDRFFTSACTTPGLVFPKLLQLTQHHIEKLQVGARVNLSKQMGALMDKLDVENEPFPRLLSLSDQGIFVLGYYQQTQLRYISRIKEDNDNE